MKARKIHLPEKLEDALPHLSARAIEVEDDRAADRVEERLLRAPEPPPLVRRVTQDLQIPAPGDGPL